MKLPNIGIKRLYRLLQRGEENYSDIKDQGP